jgi:putative peptide zinc metalloprotease protein
MSDPFFSSSWYRVENLVPTLRAHVTFHRHVYRGQLWYVLADAASARCHRLSPAAYRLAGLMDGTRNVQEIWEAANEALGDDGPSQDETIRLLGLLHVADAIRCDVSPDTLELLRRCQRRERADWWQQYANPLSVRVPLSDPDAWLARLVPRTAWLFSRPAAILALGIVAVASLTAARHWEALAAEAGARLLEPSNLLVLLVAYPLIKALHELGHALTVRQYGGEVHEMGVLFLVMMPVPYVDASAASVWPEKSRRVAVGAAGIVVEAVLASLALLLWATVAPGFVRDVAFDVAWIGAASSLLINGNPLLRFDGYYVLSDLLEIPNLRQRAHQYLTWATLRHAFGMRDVRYPVMTRGEAPWLACFGVASSVYRFAIVFAIALFLSERFFVLGVLLAVFSVTMQCLLPLARALAFVFVSPRLGARRARAVGMTLGGTAALLVCAFVVPMPLHTNAQGVVWPPEDAHVRAKTAGFVVEAIAEPGARVARGEPLLRVQDPVVETELAIEQARLRALEAKLHGERIHDRLRAQMTSDEIGAARAAVARAHERVGDVVLRSPADGRFVVPRAGDLAGRFVSQGELVGYVVGDSIATARVVVPQSDAALVQEDVRSVEVRTVVGRPEVYTARVDREVPGASQRLPSAALGTAGGGPIAVAATDPEGLTPVGSVFQLDLALPAEASPGGIGSRVHVRFRHASEPLASRAIRSVRRLFMGRRGV